MEEAAATEKMAALKKAYADIILNIAKEAASRIMISERKALCLQQDLFAAKEESLNMLLRLKKIMDSKIAEAERASLGQRQKVQELEAQLNEAEEAVVDLRAELRRVQDELEKLRNNLVKPMDEQTVKGTEHVTSNAFGTPLKQRSEDDRLFFVFENAITPTEPLVDLPSGHCYDSNTELASIAMRNKETELYRNGWTQRVRAIEQNRPIGNLPLHEQNDGHSQTKNELIVGDGGIMKQSCALTSPKVDNMEKSKEMMHCDSSCDKGGIVRFFRRTLRRRAKDDHIETITCGTTDKPAEAQVLSVGPPNSEVFPCSHDDMTESDENPSKVIGEEAQKDSNSHFAPVSTKDSNTVEERKHHPDISSENEDPTSHLPVRNVQNDTDSSEVLIEESMQTKYEQKLPDASDVSICKTNLETVDVPLVNTDSKDEKPSETVGTPIQAVNDRLLKYTFRRKRKRLPLSSHNEDCPVEKKNTSRRNSGDKQGPLPELQKPTLVMESSRDSRRLVQVARQLISLSGKRWR